MGKRKVKSDVHYIEISVVHTILKKPVEMGVVKKELHTKKWFVKEGITSVEEYVTHDNKIAKTRSLIFDKYSGRFYATHHSPEEILKHLNGESRKIGFVK